MRLSTLKHIKLSAWIFAALCLAILIFAPQYLRRNGVYMFTYWLIYVVACMGLNLVVGYAGMKSLGHAAFLGIGAYCTAIMLREGYGFGAALAVSAVLCFIVGLLVGFPALRVSMHYLAFATLGFNEVLSLVFRNEEAITGGNFGISNIARPNVLGFSFDKDLDFYYFVLVVTLVMMGLLWGLLNSPWGKAFTALRDNPIRAESVGVNIQAYTLLSFAIGAAYAGVAGAMLACLLNFIDPTLFGAQISIMMYLIVVIGGPGYFLGPMLGAAIGVVVPDWLSTAVQGVEFLKGFGGLYYLLFGSVVVVLMVWLPGGLLSIPDIIKNKRLSRAENAARADKAIAAAAQAKAEGSV